MTAIEINPRALRILGTLAVRARESSWGMHQVHVGSRHMAATDGHVLHVCDAPDGATRAKLDPRTCRRVAVKATAMLDRGALTVDGARYPEHKVGDFPDYSRVIPAESRESGYEVALSPHVLESILHAAKQSGATTVRLRFGQHSTDPIRVDYNGGVVDGLFSVAMPCRP